MVYLSDVRDFISSLNFVDDEHVYSGKLEDKKDKSVGVYSRKTTTPDNIPLGGLILSRYLYLSTGIKVKETLKRQQ